jgi:hypothetical protein
MKRTFVYLRVVKPLDISHGNSFTIGMNVSLRSHTFGNIEFIGIMCYENNNDPKNSVLHNMVFFCFVL